MSLSPQPRPLVGADIVHPGFDQAPWDVLDDLAGSLQRERAGALLGTFRSRTVDSTSGGFLGTLFES